VEDILEHVYSGGNGEGELLPVAILRDIVSGINKVVENPDADKDVDPSVAMADFQNWYEQLKGVEAPVGGAEEIGIPAEEDEDFALDVELLEAFEAEAGKNINTIFEALSVLGKTPDSQEALKNLDSACHDITSAAKMLGFTAIGDLSFKIENFADKALQGEAEFDSDKALFLRESVEAIQGVMQQKRSEKSLLPLIDSFENKLNSAEETATFENYINSAFSEDISAFIFAGKEEAFIRRYVGNVAAVLTGGAVNTWVNSLIDSPLDEWMNILSAPPQPETGKEEPVSAPAAKPAKEIVGYENSDFLLDSSAALVDSQLEMQEQLKRNKEILKELNSTQNLLNYVKSELDEIAASGADSPQKKKRQAELNSILEKAVAKMNHLVSEMGRLNTAFESRISSLDNLSFTFQRNILKARQQKAGQLYKHLEEHIAELKKFTGKEFTVEFSGESVKLDKTTLDFLYEPLKELISNAVVHGIEGPGERKKAGKPESGLINVKLSKKRNLVHLTVRDDGKGIDTALIRKKAEEKGLKIDGDETALIDTLFSSGFTLLEEKGEFAGDGEGLYQLRKTFETMRGDISLESEQGAYTQITMIFPQHLKVTDAAIISNNEDYFAIPLGADDTTTTIKKSEIVFSNGDLWVNRNGKFHPLALLSGLLSEEESKLAGNKFDAVQFKLGELDLFLVVDRVIGMETIVIRPLQKEVKAISFLAGVAQLPDSRTLLVLETDILLKELENKINFEYTVKESTVSRSQSADVKNFEHAVVFSANDVTRNFIADILREMGIETEEITEIREWTEDMDKADLLLIEEDGFHAIKEMKGLWIDAPRKIIIIHEGKLKDLPIGADGILAKPFDKEDLLKLIE
jgi:two-component system chemotaxis sensor kinase CheA